MKTKTSSPSTPGKTVAELEKRWRHYGIHRASRAATLHTWSTGWPELDALLPSGGYPVGAVTELLVERAGHGELSLLLASLAPRLARYRDTRLVLVDPPYRMNAPALDYAGIDRSRVPVISCADTHQRVWSIEQLSEAGGFIAFVVWDDHLDTPALRRLQLAGEKAHCPVFVYRDIRWAKHRSPAALRLAIRCDRGRQTLEVVKCRGPAGACIDGLTADRRGIWSWSGSARQASTTINIQAAANEHVHSATAFDPTARNNTNTHDRSIDKNENESVNSGIRPR